MAIEGLETTARLDTRTRQAVDELMGAAALADHHRPFSEQMQLEVERATVGQPGGSAFLAWAPDGTLEGLAWLAPGRDAWDLEVVVHPDPREPSEALSRRLLEAAIAEAARGGGPVRHWAFKPSAGHDAAARALGFVPERDLFQMRVALPLGPDDHGNTIPVAVRPFRPGRDEEAWLSANNRAFADHPEQGGWDLATLVEHEHLSWFDPAGFLLLDDDGRLAGSCWTKVHRDVDPALGEIYVISVDPDFAGRGLGRALTVAGLDHLASVGLAHGMLYVDAANQAAVGLYRSLGFTVDHVDRAYILAPTSRPIP